MEFFPAATLIIRVLLGLVAAYNCVWAAKWLRYLWRGERWPLSIVKCGIFTTSLGICTLQVVILTGLDSGADNAWALAGFLALLVGQFLIAAAHCTGWADNIARLVERSQEIDEIFKQVGIAGERDGN